MCEKKEVRALLESRLQSIKALFELSSARVEPETFFSPRNAADGAHWIMFKQLEDFIHELVCQEREAASLQW